jgi:transposase
LKEKLNGMSISQAAAILGVYKQSVKVQNKSTQ